MITGLVTPQQRPRIPHQIAPEETTTFSGEFVWSLRDFGGDGRASMGFLRGLVAPKSSGP